jgi:hypothetical protein
MDGDTDQGRKTCAAAGSTWIDHSYFSENHLPDWTSINDIDPGVANLVQTARAVNECTSQLYNVSGTSFAPSSAASFGTFGGITPTTYTGPVTPNVPGPDQITVTNNTSLNRAAVTAGYNFMTVPGNNAPCRVSPPLGPKAEAVGYASPCPAAGGGPFMNYTAYD